MMIIAREGPCAEVTPTFGCGRVMFQSGWALSFGDAATLLLCQTPMTETEDFCDSGVTGRR